MSRGVAVLSAPRMPSVFLYVDGEQEEEITREYVTYSSDIAIDEYIVARTYKDTTEEYEVQVYDRKGVYQKSFGNIFNVATAGDLFAGFKSFPPDPFTYKFQVHKISTGRKVFEMETSWGHVAMTTEHLVVSQYGEIKIYSIKSNSVSSQFTPVGEISVPDNHARSFLFDIHEDRIGVAYHLDSSGGFGAIYDTKGALKVTLEIDNIEEDLKNYFAYSTHYGRNIALNDKYVIVGAPRESQGAVYVFDSKTGEALEKKQSLDPQEDDLYGSCLAMSGQYMIATSPGPGSNSGIRSDAYFQIVTTLTSNESSTHHPIGDNDHDYDYGYGYGYDYGYTGPTPVSAPNPNPDTPPSNIGGTPNGPAPAPGPPSPNDSVPETNPSPDPGTFCTNNSECESSMECKNGECKLSMNSSCQDDTECASNVCKSGQCKKSVDTPCENNSECASAKCFNGVCMKPGKLGDSCTKDDECKSNFCNEGKCEKDGAPVGDSCTKNDECKSDFCNEGKCKKRDPVGDSCTKDDECKSNFCSAGKCKERDPEGASCTENSHCISSFCNEGKCRNRTFAGGSCNKNDECVSQKCSNGKCVKKDLGESCTQGAQCESHKCSGGKCIQSGPSPTPPSPTTPNPEGGSCTENSHCTSSFCNEGKCRNRTLAGGSCNKNDECVSQKCSNGKCVKKDLGESCTQGAQCQSNKCSGGKCIQSGPSPTPPSPTAPSPTGAPLGQPCTSNVQCQSNRCSGGKCIRSNDEIITAEN